MLQAPKWSTQAADIAEVPLPALMQALIHLVAHAAGAEQGHTYLAGLMTLSLPWCIVVSPSGTCLQAPERSRHAPGSAEVHLPALLPGLPTAVQLDALHAIGAIGRGQWGGLQALSLVTARHATCTKTQVKRSVLSLNALRLTCVPLAGGSGRRWACLPRLAA